MGLTVGKFRNGVKRYLRLCEEKGKVPVWSGLCNYLGVLEDEVEELGRVDIEFRREVELAKQRLLEVLERMGLEGKINSQVLRLVLANRYGWKRELEYSKGGKSIDLSKLVKKAERTL